MTTAAHTDPPNPPAPPTQAGSLNSKNPAYPTYPTYPADRTANATNRFSPTSPTNASDPFNATSPDSPDNPLCTPRTLLKGLAITVAVNSAIALALWWAGTGALDEQMVYSQGIGLTIWALMNTGARWLARPSDPGGFPRGWRAVVLVPSVLLLGASVGVTLGNWYAGHDQLVLLQSNPRMAWMMLAITGVVGGAMTLYFYMEGRKNYLQTELERTQRQTAEARLRLLETQLEPHMMFNTLANLRVLIGLDPARAQAMLDHLIAYLRSTLTASRSGPHPLAQEFERLNDYLALMAIRMGPRLQVELDLPPALRDIPLPPLLLQPLVENAIQHGLEPCVAGGLISVRAWSDPTAQLLHLQVTDTGQGLPATAPAHTTGTAPAHQTTPATRANPATSATDTTGTTSAHSTPNTSSGSNAPQTPHTKSTGFGLAQVRERLATTYGTRASLTLIANKPTGTSANVQIPLEN